MFELQNIIAVVLIAGALVYTGFIFLRKTRAFSSKAKCADDCGCSSKTKTLKSIN